MSTQQIEPGTFTTGDFARRIARAAEQAREAGLNGLLVTPGPDLVYFTGYTPTDGQFEPGKRASRPFSG